MGLNLSPKCLISGPLKSIGIFMEDYTTGAKLIAVD
jgi:hypothetical protein